MCGIFGILASGDAVPDRAKLEESRRRLDHRGPDSHGLHAEPGVGLVHTRLALVDLDERSGQPFWDESTRHALVYNGEVYNFRELRTELEQQGVRFRTSGDTEVLLLALIHWGADQALARIEGMFAFAWYDRQSQTLVLARDRLGIKPLVVHEREGAFLFASEVAALGPWTALEPDVLSVSSFLQGFDGPTSGGSFYRHVRIVPPGALVTVRRGEQAQWRRFFTMADLFDPDERARLARLPDRRLIDLVDEVLSAAVDQQMFADARVGALCSGGVDSSLVLALSARRHRDLAIFHADVVGPLSEHDAATALARHLKLELHSVAVRDQHFIDTLPEVMRHYGQPFTRHPNSVPFLMVSRLVQQLGVKAVLCGEGSDECYLGYPHFVPNVRALARGLPRRAWQAMSSWTRAAERKLRGQTFGQSLTVDDRSLVRDLHNRFERDAEEREIAAAAQACLGGRARRRDWETAFQLTYQIRTLLHRNDCLGMAAGIEARFPFLDTRLLRLAVNLPYRTKIRFSPAVLDWKHLFFRDKWIIRRVADRYLPRALSQRIKRPFPTNAFQRMRIPVALFQGSFVSDLFGLTVRDVDRLIERASQALRIRLLHLEVWGQVCLQGLSTEATTERLRGQLSFDR